MKLHLKLKFDEHYYSPARCYSYNYFLNLVCGARGTGKTTNFLLQLMMNYNKRGEEFIYLRRYKPEIKKFLSSGTINDVADGIKWRGDGAGGAIFKCEDTTIGYAMILSTAITAKSTSYPKVTTIFYDEAFLKRGDNYRYLEDEVNKLLNFASTVFRTRTNGKIIISGNNDDMFNPYFEYFNIPAFTDIYTNKERGIYAEYYKPNAKLLAMEQETPLYALTKGTQFGDYHYSNALLTNVTGTLSAKPSNAMVYFRFKINQYVLVVYKYSRFKEQRLWITYYYYDKPITNIGNNYVIMEDNKINFYNAKVLKAHVCSYFEYMYYNDKIEFNDNTSIEAFAKFLDLVKGGKK